MQGCAKTMTTEMRPHLLWLLRVVYLPLITAGSLQPVSPTEDTMITFPPSVVSRLERIQVRDDGVAEGKGHA